MPLNPEQLTKLDRLSRTFLLEFRQAFADIDYTERVTDRLQVVVPAHSPAVGDLQINLDGDEVTIFVGHHTHCHFSRYMTAAGGEEQGERESCKQAVEFVRELLADRIVIWSQRVDDKIRSGGTFQLGVGPTLKSPGVQAFLWSGRPVPTGGAA